jgi:hypothetical protein
VVWILAVLFRVASALTGILDLEKRGRLMVGISAVAHVHAPAVTDLGPIRRGNPVVFPRISWPWSYIWYIIWKDRSQLQAEYHQTRVWWV